MTSGTLQHGSPFPAQKKNSTIHRLARAIETFEKTGSIDYTMNYPHDRDFHFINSLIAKILGRIDRLFLLETLVSIVRELILNASKANYKRSFFSRMGLDINEPCQYARCMEAFKIAIRDPESIKKEMSLGNPSICFSIKKSEHRLVVIINNSCRPVREEIERINIRIEKARAMNDFSGVYNSVYDPLEGAGLGIVLIYLLMKNAGIDHSMLEMQPGPESMTVSLTIPDYLDRNEQTSGIRESIINEIESLPTFPDNIATLKTMCSDPGVSIEVLAGKIAGDPSLTADILRLANSAGMGAGRPIGSITEAIVRIGLKNLNLVISTVAAKKILDERYRRFEQIWHHCNKTASYARTIALRCGMKNAAESAFLSGLLHDIGKIVLLAVDMQKIREIALMTQNKKMISTTILEETALGMSHAEIGRRIACKWNFPHHITESIKSHHAPLGCDTTHRDLVAVVYMANMLCEIENQNAHYSFLESEMLDFFGLIGKADFEAFHENIKKTATGTFPTT